jgi:hypothetical protein
MGMHERQTYYALSSVPFWLGGVLAVIAICPLAAIRNCPEAVSTVTESDC